MSWYYSVKFAGNPSNKKLSIVPAFSLSFTDFVSISYRYSLEQLWFFSLNNSFTQKVKTKHSVHANPLYVIYIEIKKKKLETDE